MLARAHKEFQREQHSEIYLLTLKEQDKTKMELPLDMVSISASICRTTYNILSLHSWSKHTLQHFPQSIQQFFMQHSATMESKPALKQRVEDEYSKFKSKFVKCFARCSLFSKVLKK